METLDDDCCELEASIRHGNSSRAASIAKKSAEKKASLSIRVSDLPIEVPEIPVRYTIFLHIRQNSICSNFDYEAQTKRRHMPRITLIVVVLLYGTDYLVDWFRVNTSSRLLAYLTL